ncbi:hypothetical protein [Pseudodesulfovibrio sp. zrk46]|uniref:hypothetical protein n=1 Tax=Pseudodesulfovibrio sp. zrk46 TaxID=2725288 RepID=UPI001449DD37|nr:hypothetical protein [Pseudodesulfovibrio sp. zrk46]QJB58131.1 hypothetical protein HFN16_17835 [Pseudodesulfovibrio sp. zrk46]
MDKLIKALLLGTAAGIVDGIPLLLQGLSWQANLASFLHWLGLGIIITYARLPMDGWLSGLILALLTGIPFAIMTTATDMAAFVPILASSAILGTVLGFMSERLIRNQK